MLNVTGQGMIPKVSDPKVASSFIEIQTTLSEKLSEEFKKSKIEHKIFLQKDTKKSLTDTIADASKLEKYDAIIIIYINYLARNGKDVIAADLHCHKVAYKSGQMEILSDVSSAFDISSKPEKTFTSIAQDFYKLIQKTNCSN